MSIKNSVSNAVTNTGLFFRKNIDTISLIASIGCTTGIVYLEEKNTVKKYIKDRKRVNEMYKSGDITKEERKAQLKPINKDFIKKELPILGLYTGSVGLSIFGHSVTSKRLKSTTKALNDVLVTAAALQASAMQEEIEKAEEVCTESGEYQKLVDIDGVSPYARYFDYESSTLADKDMVCNKDILATQCKLLNVRLMKKKVVTLNDVYDALGFKRTEAGNAVGWVFNKPDVDMETYDPVEIDLRVFEAARVLDDGVTISTLVIDPNCDNCVIDKAKISGLMTTI